MIARDIFPEMILGVSEKHKEGIVMTRTSDKGETVVEVGEAHSPEAVCLLAINEIDYGRFFSGRIGDRLYDLLPGLRRLPEEAFERSEFERFLVQCNPEILVTAWSSPLVPADFLGRPGSRLHYVCNVTGGLRQCIPRQLMEEGLLVSNWGSAVSHFVAEGGLALLLELLRDSRRISKQMHEERFWQHGLLVDTLFGKRVGFHGFGNTAKELVRLLRPFRVSFAAYDPYVKPSVFEEFGVKRVERLQSLFSENDVLFELAALTDESCSTVTEEMLRSIPENGVFINVGRAAVVNEEGLINVALEGKLRVGLDVFHREPIPDDYPLCGLFNVAMTPHSSGATRETHRVCGEYALANIERWLKGEEVVSIVGLDQYDLMT